jgi:hypothetical protein
MESLAIPLVSLTKAPLVLVKAMAKKLFLILSNFFKENDIKSLYTEGILMTLPS